MKLDFKKFLSGMLSVIMLMNVLTSVATFADNDSKYYPYALFAASSNENAITINANNFCVNGNIATNGTIFSSGNMNINGTVQENANEEMVYVLKKLNYSYFSGDNVDRYTGDYSYEDMNININNPITVDGNLTLTGNINLNSGIKAVTDVNINGEVKNTNQAVICSETGDIIINTDNVNFNGLIYAPYGDIIIDTNNLNLNNVVIIGQTITIDCPNINANYSSSVAELVGTDSELVINLYAYGEYDSENNSIDIEWETNYTNSNYEIWYSDDNISYVSVATTDATAYQYQIEENFETRYFKVSLTTNYGETIESIPFVVKRTEDGYKTSYLDSDEDGLPDIYELELGTDINEVDTDEDGLTDYQELFILGSDPLKFDSVTECVSDADADSEEDGLSNLQEIELGTDPRSIDTDEDGISDFDEVTLYGTDPLNPDTDEDDVRDGDELLLYLDPKNPQTHGYPDLEYTSVQEIKSDSAVFSAINTKDSPYQMSLSMKTNGYAESNLKVNTSRYNIAIENDAMLGVSADISISDVCSPEDIVVKYSINQDYIANTLNKYSDCDEFKDIKRLNIFKFDDEFNMLLPIETKFDVENNSLYAEVDELGTYCVMDMEIWLDSLGVEAPINNIDNTANENRSVKLNKKNAPKKAVPESKSSYTSKPLDLVFILQTTGYSTSNFNRDKDLIISFCAYAFQKYSDINVHIITFDKAYSKILTSDSGEKYFTTNNDVIDALNNIDYTPDVREYCDIDKAFNLFFSDVTVRTNANVFIYKITNGSTISYSENNNEKIIDEVKNNIFTAYSEIGNPRWHYEENPVQIRISNKIQENGDLFLRFNSNILSTMKEHLDMKHVANMSDSSSSDTSGTSDDPDVPNPSTYDIIIPNKWKKIQLNDVLSPDNNVDTDGDGLTDWEEIDIDQLVWEDTESFTLPTFCVAEIVSYIKRFNGSDYSFLLDDFTPRPYLPILSDPTKEDSDDDGLLDIDEFCFDTEPFSSDTDGDNLSDGKEIELWFEPNNSNPDNDSFNDYEEFQNGTNPYVYNLNAREATIAFLKGGTLGDFAVPDNVETLLGQIAGSFIPFVADGRDYIANVFVNQDTGIALLNLGGFLIDIIPAVGSAGDFIKALPKLGKFVIKYADDAPKAIDAIIQVSKHFSNTDDIIPELVKILPVGALDDIADSVRKGEKITKADYDKLEKIFEASERTLEDAIETSAEHIDDGVKIWKGKDKYVPELANAIEKVLPGKVKAVEKKVVEPSTGRLLTDFDIELDNIVIQVKSGKGKGLTNQMKRTAEITKKEVISYTPDIKIKDAAVLKSVRSSGFKTFITEEELLKYLLTGYYSAK